ncbi:MAG: hypothetical protein H7A46_12310 [Verrucomicrobiales bacterium]|nr:hypothetical protein [Verrucomicrobiales bacterium]
MTGYSPTVIQQVKASALPSTDNLPSTFSIDSIRSWRKQQNTEEERQAGKVE